MKLLTVALHDVAEATWPHCAAIAEAIDERELPLSLLVVPRYAHQATTRAFERWLERRLARGDELVLHGLVHRDEAPRAHHWRERLTREVYTAGEGEFAAIDVDDARRRLDAGRAWFAQRGWPVAGFVAPAWLLGPGAWAALREQPFAYTCTRTQLLRLSGPHAGSTAQARSIVYSTRARWRRGLSQAMNHFCGPADRLRTWLRFELHPSDIAYRSVWGSVGRLLDRETDGPRVATTLGGIAERPFN